MTSKKPELPIVHIIDNPNYDSDQYTEKQMKFFHQKMQNKIKDKNHSRYETRYAFSKSHENIVYVAYLPQHILEHIEHIIKVLLVDDTETQASFIAKKLFPEKDEVVNNIFKNIHSNEDKNKILTTIENKPLLSNRKPKHSL